MHFLSVISEDPNREALHTMTDAPGPDEHAVLIVMDTYDTRVTLKLAPAAAQTLLAGLHDQLDC